MPPTRDRPGLMRVRLENRWRWHVVDPSLDAAAADAAVAELRRRNAGTNVGPVRRVVRYAPLFAFVFVVLAGTGGLVVVLEAAGLTEPLAEGTVFVVGGVALLVVAGFAAWGVGTVTTPDLPVSVTTVGVVEVDAAVLTWATDDTPVDDVWRLNEAVSLYVELLTASWTVEDLLEGWVDLDGELQHRGEADPMRDLPLDRRGDGRALVALDEAMREAVDALRVVADPLGFDPDSVLERVVTA
ncbi:MULTISPECIES: hypothetical protein [unclassified Frigoribacterium]|uniref:hypothetical protein n=1 Tax=unclassified Frigoribacterium TaxID=2627005 RepID=UPI0012FA9BFE|nr:MULTISPECIES: hypothetical protein [unclassified Frigoribacterium]